MNLRHFSLALLISALPLAAAAHSPVSFDKGDFVSARPITRDGELILSVKLSKSGKAKLKKLNRTSANQPIHTEIAGVSSDFKLREPIRGDKMEMGPYSRSEVRKFVNEINHKK